MLKHINEQKWIQKVGKFSVESIYQWYLFNTYQPLVNCMESSGL